MTHCDAFGTDGYDILALELLQSADVVGSVGGLQRLLTSQSGMFMRGRPNGDSILSQKRRSLLVLNPSTAALSSFQR